MVKKAQNSGLNGLRGTENAEAHLCILLVPKLFHRGCTRVKRKPPDENKFRGPPSGERVIQRESQRQYSKRRCS